MDNFSAMAKVHKDLSNSQCSPVRYKTQVSALWTGTVEFLTPALFCLNTLGLILPQVTLHISHALYMPLIPKIFLINSLLRPLTLRLDLICLIPSSKCLNFGGVIWIRNILLGGRTCGFNFFLTEEPLNSQAANAYPMPSAKISLLGNLETPQD